MSSSLRVRYETHEFGELDIHVRTLRDKQEFRDDDHVAQDLGITSATWPLFGVVWAAGLALARLMVDLDVQGKRVLEVGCGIGVASLVLNSRGANITATDRHPEVGGFLQRNVELNEGPPIPFVRAGWDADDDQGLGEFDIIIGSDILYERGHAVSLASFIQRHAAPSCQVIVLDSRRGHASKFRAQMAELGYSYREGEVSGDDFSGLVLVFDR